MKMSVLIVLLSLFFGCASYQPKPIDLAKTMTTAALRNLMAPCIQATHASKRNAQLAQRPLAQRPADWTADEVVSASECFSPELARAHAATELAKSNGALAKRYPGLAMVLGLEFAGHAPEASAWSRALSIELPLDLGARKSVRIVSAELLNTMAALELARARQALSHDVLQALDAFVAARAQQANVDAQTRVWQRWQAFVQQRIDEGQSNAVELLRSQQALSKLRSLRHDSIRESESAKVSLAQLMGLPVSEIEQILSQMDELTLDADSDARATLSKFDSVKRQALLLRPELLTALGNYQLSEQALKLEVAKQYPELRLAPGYIWERGLVKLPLNVSAALPPWDRNRAGIQNASSARELAARELELVQANIAADIDLAEVAFDVATRLLVEVKAQRVLAERERAIMQTQLDAGELDRLSLLAAEINVVEVQSSELSAMREKRRAWRQLARSLGLSAAASAQHASSHIGQGVNDAPVQ